MRLFEFDNQLSAQIKSNLLFLKNLSGDSSKIKVDALINTLQKQHILVTYDSLKSLIDKDPSLKNIIKDFNREEIKLNSDDEDEPQVDTSEPSDEEQAQDDEKNSIEDKVKSMADKATKAGDKVDSMAKSAAKRRS